MTSPFREVLVEEERLPERGEKGVDIAAAILYSLIHVLSALAIEVWPES